MGEDGEGASYDRAPGSLISISARSPAQERISRLWIRKSLAYLYLASTVANVRSVSVFWKRKL